MPKLPAKVAKKVDKADAASVPEGGGFKPLPRGKYVGTLQSLEEAEGFFGEPVWKAVFGDIFSSSGESAGRKKLFYDLKLPQEAKDMPEDFKVPERYKGKSREEAWEAINDFHHAKLKGFFNALGYTADTDTDEMVDDEARGFLTVGVRTIKSGPNKGNQVNQVYGVEEVPDEITDMVADLGADDDAF